MLGPVTQAYTMGQARVLALTMIAAVLLPAPPRAQQAGRADCARHRAEARPITRASHSMRRSLWLAPTASAPSRGKAANDLAAAVKTRSRRRLREGAADRLPAGGAAGRARGVRDLLQGVCRTAARPARRRAAHISDAARHGSGRLPRRGGCAARSRMRRGAR
jgi:hypothetical protein